MKYVVFFAALLLGQEASANAKDARLMWAAFSCYQFVQIAEEGEAPNADDLFRKGYEAGQRFVKAIEAGTISQEEYNTEVPIGVMGLLSGPSVDFVLGRLFEAASNDASDWVTKKDMNGLPLAISDWVFEQEVAAAIARGHYERRNCDLL